MVNKKMCVIYLTVAAILLCAGCGNKKENQTDPVGTQAENQPAATDNEGENNKEAEMPEDTNSVSGDITAEEIAEIYRFELRGHTYQLPFSVSEFEENGWNFSEGDAGQTVEGMSYVNTSVTDADDSYVRVIVVNMTDQEQLLKDCKIGGITILAKGASEVSFQTAHGISLNSTPDDIRKTYGTNELFFSELKSRDGTSSIDYRFYKGLTDDIRMPSIDSKKTDEDTLRFTVDENQKLMGIELQYFGRTE